MVKGVRILYFFIVSRFTGSGRPLWGYADYDISKHFTKGFDISDI